MTVSAYWLVFDVNQDLEEKAVDALLERTQSAYAIVISTHALPSKWVGKELKRPLNV
jgi:hypothetical protein